MTNQKHTKGPWITEQWGDGTSTSGCTNIVTYAEELVIACGVMNEEAKRIVACVNALEGIDDPEAFMRDVRVCTAEDFNFGQVLAFYGTIRKHLTGGDK